MQNRTSLRGGRPDAATDKRGVTTPKIQKVRVKRAELEVVEYKYLMDK